MAEFRAFTAEELSWAHECAAAGDPFAEIGAALCCPDAELVQARLGIVRPMVRSQAEIAELFAAGLSPSEIDRLRGQKSSSSSASHCLRRLRKNGFRLREADGAARQREVGQYNGQRSVKEIAATVGCSTRTVDRIRARSRTQVGRAANA